MKITVVIPTFNRFHIWKSCLLLDSLRRQTRMPDELIVCDDNSADETAQRLPGLLKSLPIPARMVRCTAPKRADKQASALPDNILFSLASPDSTIVHMDDDGWLSDNFCEVAERLVEREAGCYFSLIRFVDPETYAETHGDCRLRLINQAGPDVQTVKIGVTHAWGATFTVPNQVLLDIGGHDMEAAQMMGSDSRLATRIGRMIPTFFTVEHAFTHLGPSYMQKLRKGGANRREVMANRSSPVLQPGLQLETVANGGAAFWSTLRSMYEVVL